jgi:hypothetical protein
MFEHIFTILNALIEGWIAWMIFQDYRKDRGKQEIQMPSRRFLLLVAFSLGPIVAQGLVLAGPQYSWLRVSTAGGALLIAGFVVGFVRFKKQLELRFRERSQISADYLRETESLKGQLSAMKAQIEREAAFEPQALLPEVLHTVTFDYVPGSPLEHGWTQPYYKDGVAVFKTDLEIPGSLRMDVVQSVVALNYELPDIARQADVLRFTTRYSGGSQSMIFTGVDVGTRDGSQRRRLWIKYYYGERRAEITPDGPAVDISKILPERTVWLPAQLVKDTLKFDIDLRDAVTLAVGAEGWIYRSIWAFRIRGRLSISPIVFGKAK